jgi:hypothetical protein
MRLHGAASVAPFFLRIVERRRRDEECRRITKWEECKSGRNEGRRGAEVGGAFSVQKREKSCRTRGLAPRYSESRSPTRRSLVDSELGTRVLVARR